MTAGPGTDPRGLRSIRVRIAGAFVAALVFMTFAQGWLIYRQGPVADSLRLVSDGYLPLAKQVALLARDQERVQRDLGRINKDRPRPVSGETSAAEIYSEELRDNIAIARILADDMRDARMDGSEQAVLTKTLVYLDSIEQLFARYAEQSVAYAQLADAGRLEEAQDSLRRPLRNTGKQLADEFDKLQRTVDSRIRALTAATEQMQAQARAVALTASAFATLLSVGLLGASLVALRPIGQLTAEVQRVAAGVTGARVEVGGETEVGVLAREFNAMVLAIEERDRSLKERAEELRRLSRYLASVVDSLEDGLVVVEHGQVTLTNPAAARLWGTTTEAPPPEALASVLAPGQHPLAGPGATLHSVRVVPFGTDGVVAIVTDVTAQVQAQERLARSERLALVGQMLAQITHEVRNPLNALSLNAELLGDELERLDGGRATEAWDILAMIAGEIERLTALTGHYLQLARRPPATFATADVQRLLEEVVRLLEPEVEAAGGALALEVGDTGRQLVDGNQLRQAVLNVVRNALEAGGHQLHLVARRQHDVLVIALTDDGPGMTDEEARQATDPFFSTKASGTGLGLAITRQILEDHDGRVEIDTAPGAGSTVRLVLPWRPATEEDELLDEASVT